MLGRQRLIRAKAVFPILVALGGCNEVAVVGPTESDWHVATVPFFSVGEMDGPAERLLRNPLSGAVLSDGTVVVQNSMNNLFEVRYYDPQGELVRTLSRWGKGPFEFQSAFGVFPLDGDSVLVAGRDDRFAVFGPRGESVREGRLGLSSVLPSFRAAPIERDVWYVEGLTPAFDRHGPTTNAAPQLRANQVTGRVDTVEVGAYAEYVLEPSEKPGGIHSYPSPFAGRTITAVGSGTIWTGHSSGSVIRRYRGEEVVPSLVLDLGATGRPVRREDRRAMKVAYEGLLTGDHGARWTRFAAAMEFPDRMPVFDQLVVDRLGLLWVQWYEPPWAEGSQAWSVYSPDGTPVADVLVPESVLHRCSRHVSRKCNPPSGGFMDIGPDYILVAQHDSFGVARVRKYRLDRSR